MAALRLPPTAPTALVYTGPGAGQRSVLSAIESLRAALKPNTVRVETINTQSLLQGDWQEQCALLVMPGGADLPYCKSLNSSNSRGNSLIKSFVESGGAYLGLCAGAYYASRRVEFEVGTELEVVGDRELCFFSGIARGSVLKGFEYQGEGGAAAAAIEFTAPGQNTTEWQTCVDYVNGGPAFILPDDGDNNNSNSNNSKNITILARYKDFDNATAAVLCRINHGRAVLCGSHPELDARWLVTPPSRRLQSDYIGAAAVSDSDDINEEQATGVTSKGDEAERHIEELWAALTASKTSRWRYWQMLLAAAGLEQYLI